MTSLAARQKGVAALIAVCVLLGIVTPRSVAAFCSGDCNLDDTVSIDELITGVNIALSIRPLHDCPIFDGNSDGSVTVDELITAVRRALEGCNPS